MEHFWYVTIPLYHMHIQYTYTHILTHKYEYAHTNCISKEKLQDLIPFPKYKLFGSIFYLQYIKHIHDGTEE